MKNVVTRSFHSWVPKKNKGGRNKLSCGVKFEEFRSDWKKDVKKLVMISRYVLKEGVLSLFHLF